MKNNVEDNSVDLILVDPPFMLLVKIQVWINSIKVLLKMKGKMLKQKKIGINIRFALKKPKKEIEQGFGKGWSKDNYIKYGHIQGN